MDVAFRRLSQPGDLGYRLTKLEIDSWRRVGGVVVRAAGFYLEPEFLVLEESEAFVDTTRDFGRQDASDARSLRDSLIEDGTLVRRGSRYVFSRDYVFHSSSLAASVILGRPASGPDVWRRYRTTTKLADLLAEPVPA